MFTLYVCDGPTLDMRFLYDKGLGETRIHHELDAVLGLGTTLCSTVAYIALSDLDSD
jgi:hypothetical protein